MCITKKRGVLLIYIRIQSFEKMQKVRHRQFRKAFSAKDNLRARCIPQKQRAEYRLSTIADDNIWRRQKRRRQMFFDNFFCDKFDIKFTKFGEQRNFFAAVNDFVLSIITQTEINKKTGIVARFFGDASSCFDNVLRQVMPFAQHGYFDFMMVE